MNPIELFKKEPARIGSFITAVVALLVDIGVNIDEGIALKATALVAILTGQAVRQNVWNADGVQAEVEKQDPTPPSKGEWVDDVSSEI